MIVLLLVLAGLAGGGVFAASKGVLGAVAKADVAKAKASLSAELAKLEAEAKVGEQDVIAKVKALVAKL
jgi:hypothetical protein